MNRQNSLAIYEYFSEKKSVFSLDVFLKDMKERNVKLTKNQANDILHSSNYVFTLVNNEFVTRAGVFTNQWFSIKPSKEEIKKDRLVIGHRCMPFINPDVSSDDLQIVSPFGPVFSTSDHFSMNLALDTYALFGEGYLLPSIVNDKANDEYDLKAVVDTMPNKIKLTCWTISEIAGRKLKYGERLLCRVVDWNGASTVEMRLLEKQTEELELSQDDLNREKWYKNFEQGLLASFDKNGPLNSIEEQLALLFLENLDELCISSCGSCEEFLQNTKKIGFSQYGVESRIWKEGQLVPYVGEWNKEYSKDLILMEVSQNFSPFIIDAYLHQNLYYKHCKNKGEPIEKVFSKIFPVVLHISEDEQKELLADIKKRNIILEKNYSDFDDKKVADVRERALNLFYRVNTLISSIAGTRLNIQDFPQFELVVLTQLYSHLIKLIEEIENVVIRFYFPIDDVMLSLTGMEETFDDIQGSIQSAKSRLFQQSFEIV